MPRHSSTSIHHHPPSSKTLGPSCGRPAMARPSTRHDARSSLTATQVVESSASSLYQSRHRPSGQLRDARVDHAVGAQRDLADRRPVLEVVARVLDDPARVALPAIGDAVDDREVHAVPLAVVDDLGRPVRLGSGAELEAGNGARVRPTARVGRAGDADAGLRAPRPRRARRPTPDAACRTSTTPPCRGRGSRSDRSHRRAPGRGTARRQAWRRSVTGLSRLRSRSASRRSDSGVTTAPEAAEE